MLEVTLLGEITIRLDGVPLNRFRSQTEIALLAYLAHSGQAHNREVLADLLWEAGSTERALSNLRTGGSSYRHAKNDRGSITSPSTN